MSDATGARYALWLIPSDDQLGGLWATVGELAARFGVPQFGPHATLCSGEWPSGLPSLRDATEALCRDFGPVSLTVERLGQTDDYFTFFYIALADDDPQRVFKRAAAAIPGSRPPRVGPHVSLMYSDRGGDIDRSGLARELAPALPQRITFDSARLVMPAAGDWRDVASWRVEHSVKFTVEA